MKRTVTILIGRLRRRGRDSHPALVGGGLAVASTAVVAAVGGRGLIPPDLGEGPATPPGASPPGGVPGAVIDCRELFLNRRLQAALDSGDTEQLVTALELLPLG